MLPMSCCWRILTNWFERSYTPWDNWTWGQKNIMNPYYTSNGAFTAHTKIQPVWVEYFAHIMLYGCDYHRCCIKCIIPIENIVYIHTYPYSICWIITMPPHAVSWFDQPLSRHCIWREKHLATRLLIRDLAFRQGLGDLRHPMEEILVCWSGGCWSHLILRFFWGTTFLMMKLETRLKLDVDTCLLHHHWGMIRFLQ